MAGADVRISPTAHYTSHVWFANGMSHEALTSRLGRILYGAFAPINAAHRAFGRGPNLEMSLVARHRLIDHLLVTQIEAGRVGQVVEIAAGLSPRGFRFARRFRDRGLIYVEGDLPDMAAHKARALATAGLGGPNHHVVELDARLDDGAVSLRGRAAELLSPTRGTAVITEGLLGYFDLPSVEGLWRRIARTLGDFPHRLYLADLYFGGEVSAPAVRGFEALVGAFTRGRLHRHFEEDPAQACAALRQAGFAGAELRAPRDYSDILDLPGIERGQVVRILEGR